MPVTRTKNSTIPQQIFARLRQYSSGNFRFLLYSDGTFLLSPESTNKSIRNYRQNFVDRINEKVHPILSSKSYTGIKFDLEFISKKTFLSAMQGRFPFFVCGGGGVKPVPLNLVSCYIKNGSDSWVSIPRPFDLEPNTPQFSDVYPVYLSIIDTIITCYYPQNLFTYNFTHRVVFVRFIHSVTFYLFFVIFFFLFKIIFSNTIFQE